MDDSFLKQLKREFFLLDKERFTVHHVRKHIFTCGGYAYVDCIHPQSFRGWFLQYTATNNQGLYDSIVLAEEFKDYFRENTFPDLLVFEDEIAKISSLIVLFLESAGSLVEFGMFSSRPDLYTKMIVVVPAEEVEAQDSFIYLGPLDYMKKKDDKSVVVYSWPDIKDGKCEEAHLVDLCECIEEKIDSLTSDTSQFDEKNSSHIAMLLLEIIRLAFPIMKTEIEYVLDLLSVTISSIEVKRHLYLLTKLDRVKVHVIGNSHYYYPVHRKEKVISWGKTKDDRKIQSDDITISLRSSYVDDEKAVTTYSKKRRAALKSIHDKISAEEGKS